MEWIIFNSWFISPYIIRIAGVVFLRFSNVKSWLVNFASLISCCVMAVWVFYIGKTDHSTGMDVLIFVCLPMKQLPFIFIFTAAIYFIGFVVRIFEKK
ncbi:hypothetical protein OA79_17695 [Marinomonas sp. TW1]|nr:hypothetical protein OA79_17695 [Marinomonas sp. TW1]